MITVCLGLNQSQSDLYSYTTKVPLILKVLLFNVMMYKIYFTPAGVQESFEQL